MDKDDEIFALKKRLNECWNASITINEENKRLRKYVQELETYMFNDVRDIKIDLAELLEKRNCM